VALYSHAIGAFYRQRELVPLATPALTVHLGVSERVIFPIVAQILHKEGFYRLRSPFLIKNL
jgi:hypothetical protein